MTYIGHVERGVVVFDGAAPPDGAHVRVEEQVDSYSGTDNTLAKTFQELVENWEQDRPRGVDMAAMVMHPAYQRIIGMGQSAVPLLLAELNRKRGHWFWALHAITGENPVPPETEGNLGLMAQAWLKWGRDRGYIG